MIDVELSALCVMKLRRALHKAQAREIGGVMAAENSGDGVFKVCDISIQKTGGSSTSFVRSVPLHRRFIQRFLTRTGSEYERFNYLGEWHSHPSFPAEPSVTDLLQMQRLVEDRSQNARFLVLLVVKLSRDGALEGSAHAFRPGLQPVRARLLLPGATELKPVCLARRALRAVLALRFENKHFRRTRR